MSQDLIVDLVWIKFVYHLYSHVWQLFNVNNLIIGREGLEMGLNCFPIKGPMVEVIGDLLGN